MVAYLDSLADIVIDDSKQFGCISPLSPPDANGGTYDGC